MTEPSPALLLGILCLTDAAFAGYRDVAGRDARIFKAELQRKAVRRGLRSGLAVGALVFALAAGAVAVAPSPAARFAELEVTARAMLPVLAVYATAVLAALGLWAAADADLRTLASVIVLGPFTLVRPWVIVLAGALGAWNAPSVPAAFIAVGACALQLALQPWLARAWRRGGRPLG
jgi:hypothetical protein